jgi:acylpyruvate hydrolase
MKIICIGRNYAEHAKEMKAETPADPVFFMKPETAVITNGKPFYYPEFSKEVHYETEIVLKISKNGKNIQKKFAHKYYSELTVGIDFTARDLQEQCKVKGLPWEKAKAFDGSAPIGKMIQLDQLKNRNSITFHLEKNGKTVQQGNTRDLLFPFDTIIESVSRFVTLKIGDLIFTGTPAGVGPVEPGDKLNAFIENEKLFECKIK